MPFYKILRHYIQYFYFLLPLKRKETTTVLWTFTAGVTHDMSQYSPNLLQLTFLLVICEIVSIIFLSMYISNRAWDGVRILTYYQPIFSVDTMIPSVVVVVVVVTTVNVMSCTTFLFFRYLMLLLLLLLTFQ